MKIDKEKLASLAALGDRELWMTICQIAANHGYKLPENQPTDSDMEKIRRALNGSEKLNMREAVKLLNNYKKRG